LAVSRFCFLTKGNRRAAELRRGSLFRGGERRPELGLHFHFPFSSFHFSRGTLSSPKAAQAVGIAGALVVVGLTDASS
jgi:hypothetical protein